MKNFPSIFYNLDAMVTSAMRRWGHGFLRVSLGIVFLWFGALKIFGVSPVAEMVQRTYYFLPGQWLVVTLGEGEVFIGVCLISGILLRVALGLLWIQMAGTFLSFFLAPQLFFMQGNIFFLTTEGEFIIKNLVLISAGIVIGGYTVKPLRVDIGIHSQK